jgi:hypothetical protein
LISLGFCFFFTIFFFSLFKSSGKGILSGFSLALAAGGACSDTSLSCSSSFFLVSSIIFLAFVALIYSDFIFCLRLFCFRCIL